MRSPGVGEIVHDRGIWRPATARMWAAAVRIARFTAGRDRPRGVAHLRGGDLDRAVQAVELLRANASTARSPSRRTRATIAATARSISGLRAGRAIEQRRDRRAVGWRGRSESRAEQLA